MTMIRHIAKLVVALVAPAAFSLTACVASPESADDLLDDADDERVAEAQQAVIDDPDQICVVAHSSTNSGTGNGLTVGFISMGTLWQCDIPSGVGTGSTACCAPTSTSASFDKAGVTLLGFTVGYTSSSADTDGLRVTEMKAIQGSQSYSIGTFTALAVNDNVCEGCAVGTFCNSCWIDTDDHGKCSELVISGTTPYVPGSNWVYCN